MPTYSYYCNNCEKDFELFFYIKDYQDQPKCNLCKSNQTYRQYAKDISTQAASVKKSDSELKTLGDLANRNRDKLTEDQKQSLHDKHNSYKEQSSTKELPTGMTRLKKQPKSKWIN